jgi:MFS family permease
MADNAAAARRARWAVAAVFLANGMVIGSWAAHIPLAEARLGIGHASLGLALLAMAVGALFAMPLTGAFIARLGSAKVTRVSTLVFCLSLPLPVLAPNLPLLMAALFVFGAGNGVMDVAMNAHGVVVERRLGRPVMSSYHGMYSLGGLIGAGLASLLLLALAPVTHAILITAAAVAIAAVALPHLLPAEADMRGSGPAFALPGRYSLVLGGLTFLAMISEGAVLDWSALHMKENSGVSAGVAALGFAAFSATMAAGRFTGDWMRAHFGAVPLVRASGILAAAGLAMALLAPNPALAVLGFAIVGLGMANLVPVLYGAAGALPGEAAGPAIAAVATMGYFGFLSGPPLIGFLAHGTSLTLALGLIVIACLVIAFAASAAVPSRATVLAAGE